MKKLSNTEAELKKGVPLRKRHGPFASKLAKHNTFERNLNFVRRVLYTRF